MPNVLGKCLEHLLKLVKQTRNFKISIIKSISQSGIEFVNFYSNLWIKSILLCNILNCCVCSRNAWIRKYPITHIITNPEGCPNPICSLLNILGQTRVLLDIRSQKSKFQYSEISYALPVTFSYSLLPLRYCGMNCMIFAACFNQSPTVMLVHSFQPFYCATAA